MRGTHQGQQSARAASTGRTHDCKRRLHLADQNLLQGGGHPHMRRRDILALFGAVMALPCVGRGQHKVGRVPWIGYLGTSAAVPLLQDAFRQGLRDAGWVVGDNIMLDERYAEGQDDRLHTLAAELLRLPVDAIVASPTPAILAALPSMKASAPTKSRT